MRKIKHSDLAVGVELPHQNPADAAYVGRVVRVTPCLPGVRGRGWTRYRICQRGPHGLSQAGVEHTIGQLNRRYRLA